MVDKCKGDEGWVLRRFEELVGVVDDDQGCSQI